MYYNPNSPKLVCTEYSEEWGTLKKAGLLGEYDNREDADLLARMIGNAQRQIKANREARIASGTQKGSSFVANEFGCDLSDFGD